MKKTAHKPSLVKNTKKSIFEIADKDLKIICGGIGQVATGPHSR